MDPVKPLRCTAASAMGAPGRHVPGASGVGSPARNRLLEPLHLRYSFDTRSFRWFVFDGGWEPWSERG